MNTRCTLAPISWLELERLVLGELSPEAERRVKSHLDDCPLCARCLTRIREDGVALALPPLIDPALIPAIPPRPVANVRVRRRRWPLLAGGSLLLASGAAALLLLALPADRLRPGTTSKGMDVTLTLVRDRQGTIAEDPPGFRADDRWKALVTCPPGRQVSWALLLFEESSAASTISSGSDLACGNRVPLPGAFRLTGPGRGAVCFLGLGAGPSATDDPVPSPAGAACVRVSREP